MTVFIVLAVLVLAVLWAAVHFESEPRSPERTTIIFRQIESVRRSG